MHFWQDSPGQRPGRWTADHPRKTRSHVPNGNPWGLYIISTNKFNKTSSTCSICSKLKNWSQFKKKQIWSVVQCTLGLTSLTGISSRLDSPDLPGAKSSHIGSCQGLMLKTITVSETQPSTWCSCIIGWGMEPTIYQLYITIWAIGLYENGMVSPMIA